MKIVVHYPKSADKINELKKRVADIHAQTAARYIESLLCPKEQKLEIVEQLLTEINLKPK